MNEPADHPGFSTLPPAAWLYVTAIIVIGAITAATYLPPRIDEPLLLAVLLIVVYVTSAWNVSLPVPLVNGSTLSVSYAADIMSLLLVGPHQAMLVGMAGAWAQCAGRPKKGYPIRRTLFSVAVAAVTMRLVGITYESLGETAAAARADLIRPLVGAVTVYFLVNTTLIALALALSARQRVWPVWRDTFLWSAPSFAVAGGAGSLAAILVGRGDYWLASVLAAPVYLTYRMYRGFLGRIEDARRHAAEAQGLLATARQAERALAAEKERLAVTLRSIGDGVIATDIRGIVRVFNRAAEIFTGWTQDEACGRRLADVFRKLDADTRESVDDSIGRAATSDNPLGVARRTILITRDEAEVPIQEVRAPMRDTEGAVVGLVLAFRDATDTIRVQEERTKASKLESLGLLAGGIAHDFNNILTAVLGNISLARHTDLDENREAALVAAEEACVRARQLTQQLLTFSKGGAPIKKPVRLDRIVRESVRMALSGATASWIADIDPALWGVDADEGQLIQVFNNIIVNAKQAMPCGGRIVIRAHNLSEPVDRWEFGLKVKAGPYVGVSIMDEGVGITADDLLRIFDPYFTTKAIGSGLGLATSRSIIKNHGGYIAVDSQVGRGTTVRVCLPASLATPVGKRPASDHVNVSGTARVLVLDDEEAIRTLAVKLLRQLGYAAEAVGSGAEAIARYGNARDEGRPFDLVLLDLTIPGEVGGRDVLRALTAIDPDVKAIVISGYASDDVMAHYRDYGFQALVAKPFTLHELSAALNDVAALRPGSPRRAPSPPLRTS